MQPVRIALGTPAHGTQVTRNAATWYRLDAAAADPRAALQADIGLDALTAAALTIDETRPRCTPHGDGALLILRGINTEPGADPEDMVSLRIWIDSARIVTFQFRHLDVVNELADEVLAGHGPGTSGDFVVVLTDRLTDRMQEIVESVDGALDGLEDTEAEQPLPEQRRAIAGVRRKIVLLRRFIAPQRDALNTLIAEPFDWQTDLQDRRLKDIVDRITRLVEQLDSMHLRASILQDFISVRVAERLNRTMVLLSIVAGVFLPLSFFTGLLGMNVAGIPWADNARAFYLISLLLVSVGLATFIALWRFRHP